MSLVIFSIFRSKNTMKKFENRQSGESKVDLYPWKPPEMSISQKLLGEGGIPPNIKDILLKDLK